VIPNVPLPRRELVTVGTANHDNIDRALRTGTAVAPYRGVIVAAQHANGFLARCTAALATQDASAVLSRRAAAVALELPWTPASWATEATPVDVSVIREDRHRRSHGLRLCHSLVPDDDVVLINGLRVTSPARTLIDLARDPELRIGRLLTVQLMDGARRFDRCTGADLDAAVKAAAGLRNVVRARDWVALSRDGIDSPMETTTRLVLLDGGAPYVDVGIEIRDDDGLLLARSDLGDKQLMIWGEYDGFDAHSKRNVFSSDRRGDRWLAGRGWYVIRIVAEDLQRPRRLADEWLRARADAPSRIAALDPRRSSELATARRALGID
jgi:hypothetical protein